MAEEGAGRTLGVSFVRRNCDSGFPSAFGRRTHSLLLYCALTLFFCIACEVCSLTAAAPFRPLPRRCGVWSCWLLQVCVSAGGWLVSMVCGLWFMFRRLFCGNFTQSRFRPRRGVKRNWTLMLRLASSTIHLLRISPRPAPYPRGAKAAAGTATTAQTQKEEHPNKFIDDTSSNKSRFLVAPVLFPGGTASTGAAPGLGREGKTCGKPPPP